MNTTCTIQTDPYKSKLERDYADVLEMLKLGGEIQCWQYEPVRVKVGGGAYYKPDFMVLENDGQIRFDETKGVRREADLLRVRAAAHKHPYFRFQVITRKKKQWQYERINP